MFVIKITYIMYLGSDTAGPKPLMDLPQVPVSITVLYTLMHYVCAEHEITVDTSDIFHALLEFTCTCASLV